MLFGSGSLNTRFGQILEDSLNEIFMFDAQTRCALNRFC